jgi:GntR family transcriptional regulator, transcriptional repressor for pyruvate dehydrogenase complex
LSDNLTAGPIERRKTYELVAERLLGLIAARSLEPGDSVPPERELVEAFRVGRSSVREALRMLESRGLIQSRGNGSFVVSEFGNPLHESLALLVAVDEADERELFEARWVIEGETAALAADRRDASHLDQMAAAIDAMERGLDSESTYIDADLVFHLTVAEASGNRVVSHLMHAIRGQVQRALGTAFLVPGGPQRSLDQHREILDAVASRRPDDARRVMHDHIRRVEREIHELGGRR